MALPAVKGEIVNFFGIADCILKKGPYPADEVIQKHCSQWMLNNYFSCNEKFAPLAAELSTLKMSNKEYFDVLYYGIPRSSEFIRYNAQKAKADMILKNITTHYGCSIEIAKYYMKIISPEEIDQITELYEPKGIRR